MNLPRLYEHFLSRRGAENAEVTCIICNSQDLSEVSVILIQIPTMNFLSVQSGLAIQKRLYIYSRSGAEKTGGQATSIEPGLHPGEQSRNWRNNRPRHP